MSILAFDRWDALAWHEHIGTIGDPLEELLRNVSKEVEDGKRLAQYLRNVYDEFKTHPPTLFLHFREAHWELGNVDEWGLMVQVPRPIFNTLLADIRDDRCLQLSLGFKLAPPLSDDEHAPPSMPVTFSVLPLMKSSWGSVERISWNSGNSLMEIDDINHAPSSGEADTGPVRATSDVGDAILRTSITQLQEGIQSLALTTRVGFLLVLVLIIVLALLR